MCKHGRREKKWSFRQEKAHSIAAQGGKKRLRKKQRGRI